MQTLEKKISILEKAVELNPDNEDLLLCLLKAYQSRDSAEVIMERWEKILRQQSGSCKLWKEFLLICQGEFSRFRVSDVRKIYACSVRSLSAACSKLHKQVLYFVIWLILSIYQVDFFFDLLLKIILKDIPSRIFLLNF